MDEKKHFQDELKRLRVKLDALDEEARREEIEAQMALVRSRMDRCCG